MRTISIGKQNFASLRENDFFYVDKTDFIREWWENGDDVTLIARPRRFGKTLNMSMLECFFSNRYKNREDLFKGLSIWREKEYRLLQGTYPVLSLTFSSAKGNTYEILRKQICALLAEQYRAHRYLSEGDCLYLKVKFYAMHPRTLQKQFELSLTNFEVELMFERLIREWFGRSEGDYQNFAKSLIRGDLKAMNHYMNKVALHTFSFFDTGNQPSRRTEPERFYHGFVLGLLVDQRERYQIRSNRESGFGRYDVLMQPCGAERNSLPALVLEFKIRDAGEESSLEETVAAALRQIREKEYDAELVSAGIPRARIRHYGFAFEGKHVLIGTDQEVKCTGAAGIGMAEMHS